MIKYVFITLLALGLVKIVFAENTQYMPPSDLSLLIANKQKTKAPISFQADSIEYDQELNITNAIGNVIIQQNQRTISANRLIYNQKENIIRAEGDIRFTLEDGTIFFSDFLEIDDELRDGIIKEIKVLLEDDSRITARQATLQNANRTEFSYANYTPCEVCKENPDKAPIWQIKADQIIHNRAKQRIEYSGASLEFGGVPVLFTPYFTHPDPTVYRSSGFLSPSVGSDTHIGSYIRIPYYQVISDHQDLTIEPITTTKSGQLLAMEYNQAFVNGDVQVSGSINESSQRDVNGKLVKDHDIRGHIYSQGLFQLDEDWRWGFDANHVSDSYYLPHFGLWGKSHNYLKSNIYTEALNQRNYFRVDSSYYKDVRIASKENSPATLPNIAYSGFGQADQYGGRWDLSVNARSFYQNSKASSQLLSLTGGYEIPLIHKNSGLLTRVRSEVRGDASAANINNTNTQQAGTKKNNTLVVPRLDITSSLPMVTHYNGYSTMVEPIVAMYMAPNIGDQSKLFNADSNVFSYNHTNIFDSNRFAGLDRIEGGQQFAYGARVIQQFQYGGELNLFAGQFYRKNNNTDLIRETGLSSQRSDVVSRVEFKPFDNVSFDYSARFDKNDYNVNHSQLGLNSRFGKVDFSTDYVFYRKDTDNSTTNIEQYQFDLNFQHNNFKFDTNYQADLVSYNTLKYEASIQYIIDCLIAGVAIKRDFTRIDNKKDNKSILFTLSLLNLGGAETDFKRN